MLLWFQHTPGYPARGYASDQTDSPSLDGYFA
jgi:hypothetical protein